MASQTRSFLRVSTADLVVDIWEASYLPASISSLRDDGHSAHFEDCRKTMSAVALAVNDQSLKKEHSHFILDGCVKRRREGGQP